MGAKAAAKPLKFIVKRRTPGPSSSSPAAPYDWDALHAQIMDVSRAVFLSSKRLDQLMRSMDRPGKLAVYSMLEGVVLPGATPPRLSEAENIVGAYILPARTELEALAQEYAEAKSRSEKRSLPLPAAARHIERILSSQRRISSVIRNLSRLQGEIRSGRLDPNQPAVRREYALQLDVWAECDRQMARLLGIEKTPSGDLRAHGRYMAPLAEAVGTALSPNASSGPEVPAPASPASLPAEGYRLKGRYVVPIRPMGRIPALSSASGPALQPGENGPTSVPPTSLSPVRSANSSVHLRRSVRTKSTTIPVHLLPAIQTPASEPSPPSSPAFEPASGVPPASSEIFPPSRAVVEYASDLADLLDQPGADIAQKVMVVSELAKLAPERPRLPAALRTRILFLLGRLSGRDPNVSLRLIAREAVAAWSGRKA